jgi:hypothetical protein
VPRKPSRLRSVSRLDFTLRPRFVRDAQGNPQLASFCVDFFSGFVADGWQGAIFTPRRAPRHSRSGPGA